MITHRKSMGRLTAAGGSGGTAGIIGALHVNTTAVGNVEGGEDDLMSYSLPANTLSVDGKGVRIRAWGTYAANGNTKSFKMYFGATEVGSTNNVTTSGGAWTTEGVVIRTGAATQEAFGLTGYTTNSAMRFARTTPTETLSGAVVIKVTGTSGAAATDDVVQRGMIVEMLN